MKFARQIIFRLPKIQLGVKVLPEDYDNFKSIKNGDYITFNLIKYDKEVMGHILVKVKDVEFYGDN